MLMSALKPLAELESAGEFVPRHIGIDADAEARMLSVIGAASRRALIEQVVPPSIARAAPMRLPAPLGEAEALAELRAIAAQNRVLKSFIGQGYHGTHTPGVILRNVLENPAWYTAYTPYQAEISQGRLEALVNFQTMVSRPHRDGDRQRVDARRGDRRRRSDDARAAQRQEREQQDRRRRRQPSADDRGDAHARRAARPRGRSRQLGRGVVGTARRRRLLRGARAIPGDERRAARPARRRAAHPRARRGIHRRRRPARADADRAAGRARRRHRLRNDAALRHADGLRRAARRVPRVPRRIQARPAGAAGRRQHRRARRHRRTGSRCRRASSTSGARRRPATSARRRCCRPWSRACTPSTTGRRG